MKKLVLLTAILLGAASASQAGIRFSFGIGIPVGPPVVTCPAPVYVAPAPVYVLPAPVCQAPVVYTPPPVVYAPAPSIYVGVGSGWCWPGYRWGHYRGWDHDHGHGRWHR